MASTCNRLANRASSFSSIRAAIRSTKPKPPSCSSSHSVPFSTSSSSTPLNRFSLSSATGMRAVAFATPQRSCGGEIDVLSEHNLQELPSTLTGHIMPICLKEINWDFTRPANNAPTASLSKLGLSVPR